jgi:hypothetical protein
MDDCKKVENGTGTITTTMDMHKSEIKAGIHAVCWNFDAETEQSISTFFS